MKIVIVTGSSRGLGASTALECARRGMGVVVTCKSNPEKAEGVVKAIAGIGGKAVVLQLDVGNSRSSGSPTRPSAVCSASIADGEREVDATFAAPMAAGATEIHPPGPQLHYDPRYYAAGRRVLAGEARPGFQTPAMLFGNGFAETIADTTIVDV